jgi:hypothetical protein
MKVRNFDLTGFILDVYESKKNFRCILPTPVTPKLIEIRLVVSVMKNGAK